MKVVETSIPDVLIIEPKVFGDERGFFYESFNAADRKYGPFYQSCDRPGSNEAYGPGNDAGANFGNINAVQATQDSIMELATRYTESMGIVA